MVRVIHHVAVSIVVGALDLAVFGHIHVGGLQNAGVVIKHAGNAVDHNGALAIAPVMRSK